MKKVKKTVGEKLSQAALQSTQLHSSDASNTSEDEFEMDYELPSESSLRKATFENNDPKYDGAVVSRSQLAEESEDEFDENASLESEEMFEVGSHSELESQSDVESDGQSDGQSEGESEGESDFEEGDAASQAESKEDFDGDVEKQLSQMKKDEELIMSKLSSSFNSDIEKGTHVRNQLGLWDSLLDMRIRLQKAVETANRMPLAPIVEDQDNLQDLLQQATNAASGLLTDLLHLKCDLAPIDIPAASSIRKRKRLPGLDQVWSECILPLEAGFKPFRDETIEKWNNKIQTSQALPLQKKFKAINQSVLHQIKTVLVDQERLVKRTQLKRSSYLRFGETQEPTADEHGHVHDPQVFDDSDYYQQLLKELIESRLNDTDDPVMQRMKYAHLKSMDAKKLKKRGVETRASKGRKVRFHVHEKIQNFMASQPRGSWHTEMIDELFASLFGQAVETQVTVSTDGFNLL